MNEWVPLAMLALVASMFGLLAWWAQEMERYRESLNQQKRQADTDKASRRDSAAAAAEPDEHVTAQ